MAFSPTNRPTLTVVLAFLVLGAGCAADERAFYIVQNQAPTDGCAIPATVGDVYRAKGLLDVSLGVGYELFPVVKNDLPSTAATVSTDPERNNLSLRRFEVTLDLGWFADHLDVAQLAQNQLTDFSVAVSGSIPPAGTRSAAITAIPDGLVPQLTFGATDQPTIYAHVVVVADHDGSELKSQEFIYPIDLCSKCLINELSSCPATGETPPASQNFCGLPQDVPLSCCKDNRLGQVCLTSAGTPVRPHAY